MIMGYYIPINICISDKDNCSTTKITFDEKAVICFEQEYSSDSDLNWTESVTMKELLEFVNGKENFVESFVHRKTKEVIDKLSTENTKLEREVDSLKEQMENAISHLTVEFSNIRAGKASPSMLRFIR